MKFLFVIRYSCWRIEVVQSVSQKQISMIRVEAIVTADSDQWESDKPSAMARVGGGRSWGKSWTGLAPSK